jgi:hypothetical protein
MCKAQANSYKTAIVRKKPSRPSQYLNDAGLIRGEVLDFGCGRGFDADHFSWQKYDPHFFPDYPKGMFDTVVCNFVLNTLPKVYERNLLFEIGYFLKLGGKAYITVRRDVKQHGFTASGSFQRNVELKLPVIHETSEFCIYELK